MGNDKKTTLISRQDFITKALKGLGLLSLASALNSCKQPNEDDPTKPNPTNPTNPTGKKPHGGVETIRSQCVQWLYNDFTKLPMDTVEAGYTTIRNKFDEFTKENDATYNKPFVDFEIKILKAGQSNSFTHVSVPTPAPCDGNRVTSNPTGAKTIRTSGIRLAYPNGNGADMYYKIERE